MLETVFSILLSLIEPASVLLIVALLIAINKRLFEKIGALAHTGNFFRNSIYFLIVFVGALTFILSLPFDKALKGQVLSFLGIIISAGIALSSTTLLGNFIAGLMNNNIKRFKVGDLIKIDDIIGRVTQKNLLHTELQLEDSNFITIPNLYISTHPIKITRKSNTVISTSLSLGYDLSRVKVEEALKEAAIATELTDPYVYIVELGDYSVTYKIHGFLKDSDKYFSTRSRLNSNVIDVLSKKDIEIVSPTFMNQRRVDDQKFIPDHVHEKPSEEDDDSSPEDLIFDEAIKSEEIEKKKSSLKKINIRKSELKEQLKDEKNELEKERLNKSLMRIEEIEEKIMNNIEAKKRGNRD